MCKIKENVIERKLNRRREQMTRGKYNFQKYSKNSCQFHLHARTELKQCHHQVVTLCPFSDIKIRFIFGRVHYSWYAVDIFSSAHGILSQSQTINLKVRCAYLVREKN